MKTTNLVLIIIFLITITKSFTGAQNTTVSSYDPAELLTKIFSPNSTAAESRQRGYGLIKFEDQDPNIDPRPYPKPYADPEKDQTPLRFIDEDQNYAPYYIYKDQNYIDQSINFDNQISNGQVTFQDDNRIEGNKKKRKRRRKPKNGLPSRQTIPGYEQYYSGYPYAQPYRPPRRRPRPSLASAALSSVTEALTSIATYDDYQCVPRLLCEAAGGRGFSSNGLLQSVAGIQPLLTLLSTYNGISTSPLFVFGRAVFLGMTSKGNTGTCRYAYPQCPNDPEDLIFYLNNYNGGFFRFFSAPQSQPQNIEQFYNHLGQYQGPFDYQGSNYNDPQAYNPNYPQNNGQYNYDYHNYNRPSLYNNNQGNYANNYNYNNNQIRFQDDNRIQKRIQNRPHQELIDDSFEEDDYRSGWLFPDENNDNYYNNNYNNRDVRTMRFPESSQTHNHDYRKGKVINYPENVYNSQNYNDRPHTFSNRYETSTYSYNSGQNYNNNYNYQTTQSYNNNYNQGTKYYNYNQNPNDYQNNQNYNNQGIKYYIYNQSPSDNQNYDNNNYYNRPNNYQNYDNGNTNAVRIYYNQVPANNYNNKQNYYNNHQNMYSNNQKYPQSTIFNNEEYVYDHKHNFYIKKENNNFNQNSNDYNNNYNNKNRYHENNGYNQNNNYNSNKYQSNNGYNQNNNYNSNKYQNNNDYNQNNNYYNPNNNYNQNNNYNNDKNNYYDNNYLKRGEPDNGLKTVYVVRGHGDPNKPEVVKLKPGQSVH